jgi:hypothetical protein
VLDALSSRGAFARDLLWDATHNEKAKSRFLAKATRNDSLSLSVTNYATMAQYQTKRALHFCEGSF